MDNQNAPQFARLTKTGLRPETLDDVMRRFAETSVPVALKEPGCRGLVSLVNRDRGKVFVVTLWHTSGDQAPTSSSYDTMQNVATFSSDWTRPLIRETYAVLVSDLPASDRSTIGWYARVTSMKVRQEYWEPLIQAGWLAAEQLAQQQPGYLGAIGLGDPGSGRAMFVELWESRAALRASETTAYRQERTARAVRMLVGVPRHEIFQVYMLSLV
jgi:quinol monooxygenase YgiN